jgi:hypothetical protein
MPSAMRDLSFGGVMLRHRVDFEFVETAVLIGRIEPGQDRSRHRIIGGLDLPEIADLLAGERVVERSAICASRAFSVCSSSKPGVRSRATLPARTDSSLALGELIFGLQSVRRARIPTRRTTESTA